MLKKIFLINPLVYTIIIVGITFGIQFFSGARLAYFVVDVVDSGLEEACQYGCDGEEISNYPIDCYYYGGCLVMQNGIDISYMRWLFVFFLFIASILINYDRGNRYMYKLIGFVLSIVVYHTIGMYGWFDQGHEMIGLEHLFISLFFVLPLLLTSFVVSLLIFRKAKAPNKSGQSRTPNGEK